MSEAWSSKGLPDSRLPRVPLAAVAPKGERCGTVYPVDARSYFGVWRCSRRRGHRGRHAAILVETGLVCAVWPEPRPRLSLISHVGDDYPLEPCS